MFWGNNFQEVATGFVMIKEYEYGNVAGIHLVGNLQIHIFQHI